jgi:hypothetical protein
MIIFNISRLPHVFGIVPATNFIGPTGKLSLRIKDGSIIATLITTHVPKNVAAAPLFSPCLSRVVVPTERLTRARFNV